MAKRKRIPPLIADTVVAVTPRLQSNDCATWALKTFTGRSYADVQQAVIKEDPKYKGNEGLSWDEIIAVAKRLGVILTLNDRPDLEADSGILGVTFNNPKESPHVVVLMQGPVVINTDGTVWRADDYFAVHDARPDGILVVKD